MSGLSSIKENSEIIKQEREVFYKENATFFNPLIRQHKDLLLKTEQDSKKPRIIRFVIKGLRKLNLYK